MSLSTTIKSIQDIMRKDDGVDGDAQRIGQLTWMLFLKIYDQREEEWEDDAEDAGKTFKSVIPKGCRWRDWAKPRDGIPAVAGSELIDHINSVVFPALKDLTITKDARSKVVREVFADSNNYMKSGPLMLEVIQKLEDSINFHNQGNRDELGNLYEQLLNDLRSAGNAGEFYTPRGVTEFMVKAVNPSLKKREVMIDPACGTGGFITATIEHLRGQLTKRSSAEDRAAIETSIRGIEKKQLPHLLCVTNLLLHGIDVPSQIDHTNTLAKGWNGWGQADRVDCVITNPPFGGMEDDGVGTDFPADIQTRETADMFMSLISKKLLKKGGRAAVVLPDGTLFGDGVKAVIKKKLMEDCNLHTIIRMPNGVFAPYTGIKTNLLFFTHGKPTETIWYYEHRYPEGQKSYSKTKPLRVEELLPILDWWGKEKDGFAARVETEQAWKVDFAEKKQDAEKRAKPHWDKAESLKNDAARISSKLKDVRAAERKEKDQKALKKLQAEVEQLEKQEEALTTQSKNEQATGDQIYWPIFNLDIDNPNTKEAESHDPDEVLAELVSAQQAEQQTLGQLKQVLDAALGGDA